LLGLAACHPLASWNPSKLPTSDAKAVTSSHARWPASEVEVLYDDDGIPHIYGKSEEDRSYGIGWVHGRDRLFQAVFRKHGASGRLTELLGGDKWLSADQFLRMNVYLVDAWEKSLSDRDRGLLESYVAGINDGARETGYSTAELAVLGYEWEPFTVRDALAVSRGLMGDQSNGALNHELTILRVLNRLKDDDPRAQELLADIGLRADPVVATSEQHNLAELTAPVVPPATETPATDAPATDTPATDAPATDAPATDAPAVPEPAKTPPPKAEAPRFDGPHKEMVAALLDEKLGESNSWAVNADRTTTGRPFLANDPHMTHDGPSLWTYAHFESPDGTFVAGGTLAGAGPVVFIGYSDKAAWGNTNATVDCQDLVRIKPVEGKEDTHYWLDDKEEPYGASVQRYKLGQSEDAEVFEETWKTTVFGPLTPPGWDFRFDEGDGPYAFQWCAFAHAERSDDFYGAINDFKDVQTAEDVFKAVDGVAMVPFSTPFVLDSGDVVYSMSAIMPKRPEGVRYDRPRDGLSRADNWDGFIDPKLKPRSINPKKGYVNASNQRIVEEDHPMNGQLGFQGDRGLRATRISQRLEALLADGKKASPEQLFEIQKDVHSLNAERVAPVLAKSCPKSVEGVSDQHVSAICAALRDFDFEFTTDSRGAVVYEWVYEELREEVLTAHFGADFLELKRPSMRDAALFHVNFERLVLREGEGEKTATFDDIKTPEREGIEGFLRRAIPPAVERLTAAMGGNPDGWRWGRVHTIEFDNPLKGAPVFGWLFSTPPTEQDGCPTCVRAEYGTPITFGSALRLYADMGEGGQTKMVIDSGNSGHYGHEHNNNLHERWTKHEPFDVAVPRDDVKKRLYGWVKIKPKR
jgi:penicillin amidase